MYAVLGKKVCIEKLHGILFRGFFVSGDKKSVLGKLFDENECGIVSHLGTWQFYGNDLPTSVYGSNGLSKPLRRDRDDLLD